MVYRGREFGKNGFILKFVTYGQIEEIIIENETRLHLRKGSEFGPKILRIEVLSHECLHFDSKSIRSSDQRR